MNTDAFLRRARIRDRLAKKVCTMQHEQDHGEQDKHKQQSTGRDEHASDATAEAAGVDAQDVAQAEPFPVPLANAVQEAVQEAVQKAVQKALAEAGKVKAARESESGSGAGPSAPAAHRSK